MPTRPLLLACCTALLAPAVAAPGARAQPAATLDARSPADALSLQALFGSYGFYGASFRGGQRADEGPLLTFAEQDRTSGASTNRPESYEKRPPRQTPGRALVVRTDKRLGTTTGPTHGSALVAHERRQRHRSL